MTEKTNTHGGRRADLDGRYFRSGWEANYARYLRFLVEQGVIASWEYEPKEFKFPVERGNMYYKPDFLVTNNDGSKEWHEVKGYMDKDSAVKLKRFAKFFPEERLILIERADYNDIKRKLAGMIDGWED